MRVLKSVGKKNRSMVKIGRQNEETMSIKDLSKRERCQNQRGKKAKSQGWGAPIFQQTWNKAKILSPTRGSLKLKRLVSSNSSHKRQCKSQRLLKEPGSESGWTSSSILKKLREEERQITGNCETQEEGKVLVSHHRLWHILNEPLHLCPFWSIYCLYPPESSSQPQLRQQCWTGPKKMTTGEFYLESQFFSSTSEYSLSTWVIQVCIQKLEFLIPSNSQHGTLQKTLAWIWPLLLILADSSLPSCCHIKAQRSRQFLTWKTLQDPDTRPWKTMLKNGCVHTSVSNPL